MGFVYFYTAKAISHVKIYLTDCRNVYRHGNELKFDSRLVT